MRPGQGPNREKGRRSREMIAASLETQRAFFAAQTGRVEEVLFEQERDRNVYEGYTRNYTPVRVASAAPLQGQILQVRLTQALEDFCLGELVL